MNSAASRQVVMPPMAEMGHVRAHGIAGDFRHHRERNRLDRGAAHASVRALAVDDDVRRHVVEIDVHDRIDSVDERHRIGAALFRRARRLADVGDVGRQLDDDWHSRVRFAPARDHLDIFRHLTDGRAHATLRHAMRAAEIELNAVTFSFLDPRENGLPGLLVARNHQRHDEGAIRPSALDLLDFLQVDFEVAVGDELDVVHRDQPTVGAMDRAVTRAGHIDDRRARFAQRLPHDAAPAGAERTLDVDLPIGGRSGGEPERVGRFDAKEASAQIGHRTLASSRPAHLDGQDR